ncbi:MAG: F0F1 ATP synthase subunit epsilon [Myxococcota bacterium]
MNLRVLLPQKVFVDVEVDKVIAESPNGSFCLLERHVDFTSALAPGLLSYVRTEDGDEVFVAVDEGVLVKAGRQVRVSVRRATQSDDLQKLEDTVDQVFRQHTDRERRARSALARLEANFVRRFLELKPD